MNANTDTKLYNGNTIKDPLIIYAVGNTFKLNKRLAIEDEVRIELVDKQLLVDAEYKCLELIEFGRRFSLGYSASKILQRWREERMNKNKKRVQNKK